MERKQPRVRDVYGAFKLLFFVLLRVGLNAIPTTTFLAVLVQACVYLRLFSLPWSNPEDACIGVNGVLFKREWQRIFYGAVEHGDSMHLYYNMVSFIWKGTNIEQNVGALQFAWMIFMLTMLTGVLIVGLYYLLGTYVDAIFYQVCGIGFSGVIFALKVLDNVVYATQSRNVLGFPVELPSGYIVWLELILVQIMSGNNCGFIGHLAGVLAGFVYIGAITPSLNALRQVLIEAPKSAVRYLCPCLLPVPYGAILLSAASLATNADLLSTSELKQQAVGRPSWTSSMINEGQWHLLLAPVLHCSGRLHLAYTVVTLLGLGYRLERKVGTLRFLADAAILAIVTNVAYNLTTHHVLPLFIEVAGASPAQMRHTSFATPTAILLALKALYGDGRWLRRYPLLFLAVPMPSFVGAIIETGLLQFVLPHLSIVEHTVGFLGGLMVSYVLPQP
ncbi:hypothetical protein MTO96_004633 [Rhipicephalus appendiculatus]